MGYPIAPAWLLGSRLLNQSQIGLWTACYEYIFLRLHRQENTSSRERAEAIHYDFHCNEDVTCTPAPWFKSTECSHCFRCFTLFPFLFRFYLDCSCLCFLFFYPVSLSPSRFISLPLFSLSPLPLSFLLSSQPSGHRLSFKVLILIWNLLQSVQHWTWNTGLWDLICVYKHACLRSDGFLLHFQSKIINETPGRVAVKHVRWCIIHFFVLLVYW